MRQWLHVLPLPLATFDATVPVDTALLAVARGIVNAFAILAFGFLVNAISDRHVDRDARKNPLLVPGRDGYKASLVTLPAVSIALAAFSPWPVQLATAFSLMVGIVYSVGPRLKIIPVVGTLTNAAWYTPVLFLGMAGPSLPAGFGGIAIAFTTLLLQNQLIHEAGDRIEDEASGIRTTWLALGPRWTALLAACVGAVATVVAAPSSRRVPVRRRYGVHRGISAAPRLGRADGGPCRAPARRSSLVRGAVRGSGVRRVAAMGVNAEDTTAEHDGARIARACSVEARRSPCRC